MKIKSNDIILFSGDSITDGNRGHNMDCNHIMGHGYQFIISAHLALKNADNLPKFINKGYSGYTMQMLLEKWEADVLANNPTVVSILAGVNDCHYGCNNGSGVDEISRKYENALKKAIEHTKSKNSDTKIIICEPFYFPLDRTQPDYRFTPHPNCESEFLRPDRFDTDEMCRFRSQAMKEIQKAARKTADAKADVFVPLADRFKSEIAKSRTEYFVWDGTHPTVAGHALIAEEWLKATQN